MLRHMITALMAGGSLFVAVPAIAAGCEFAPAAQPAVFDSDVRVQAVLSALPLPEACTAEQQVKAFRHFNPEVKGDVVPAKTNVTFPMKPAAAPNTQPKPASSAAPAAPVSNQAPAAAAAATGPSAGGILVGQEITDLRRQMNDLQQQLSTAKASGDTAVIAALEAKIAQNAAATQAAANAARQAAAEALAARDGARQQVAAALARQGKPGFSTADLQNATMALRDAQSVLGQATAKAQEANEAAALAVQAKLDAEAAAAEAKASAAEAKSWAEKAKDTVAGVWDWIYGNALATALLALLVLWLIAKVLGLGRRVNALENNQSATDEQTEQANREIRHTQDQLGFRSVVFDQQSLLSVNLLRSNSSTQLKFKVGQQKYAVPVIRLSDGRFAVKGEPDLAFNDPEDFVHAKLRSGRFYKFRV